MPTSTHKSHFLRRMRNGAAYNANVDGSTTPVEFIIRPDDGYNLLVTIFDFMLGATGKLNPDGYAGGNALTNGIQLGVYHDTTGLMLDLLDGVPVKSNLDWAVNATNSGVYEVNATGQEENYFGGAIDFTRYGGVLRIAKDESLRVIINDDVTGLDYHYFRALGYQERRLNG